MIISVVRIPLELSENNFAEERLSSEDCPKNTRDIS
jgi:hypothetical protein